MFSCHEQRHVVNLSKRVEIQNFLFFFLVNFLSLEKKICASLSGPFVLFAAFSYASFSCTSSSFLPPQKRESIIYLHLSNDDDAFLFCEDFPNGGGRYYQGTLKFSLSSRLSFVALLLSSFTSSCACTRSLFVCFGGWDTFLMDRKRWALEPPRESKRSSSFTSSSLRSSLNPDLLFCARASFHSTAPAPIMVPFSLLYMHPKLEAKWVHGPTSPRVWVPRFEYSFVHVWNIY